MACCITTKARLFNANGSVRLSLALALCRRDFLASGFSGMATYRLEIGAFIFAFVLLFS